MDKFYKKQATAEGIRELTKKREPDFTNILKILKKKRPDRHTLFEFGLEDIGEELTCRAKPDAANPLDVAIWMMDAFRNGGYDYFSIPAPSQTYFPKKEHQKIKSISLNNTSLITDRKSYERYAWPVVKAEDYWHYEEMAKYLIPGMKAIVRAPGGLLELVTTILGYDNLCYLLYDDKDLVRDVFNRVGGIMLEHYRNAVCHDIVGAVFVSDDWGFNTQTMLSVNDMRKYVIPWTIKFVEVIHAAGKPAILHSCGQLASIMDDVIDVIGFDGKHSFEDNITHVEKAYELWGDRIAILGGLDMNFLCSSTPEDVFKRANNMLRKTLDKGGYALGSGNSITYYMPKENYYAMTLAAL